jgi:hypothetical protein
MLRWIHGNHLGILKYYLVNIAPRTSPLKEGKNGKELDQFKRTTIQFPDSTHQMKSKLKAMCIYLKIVCNYT